MKDRRERKKSLRQGRKWSREYYVCILTLINEALFIEKWRGLEVWMKSQWMNEDKEPASRASVQIPLYYWWGEWSVLLTEQRRCSWDKSDVGQMCDHLSWSFHETAGTKVRDSADHVRPHCFVPGGFWLGVCPDHSRSKKIVFARVARFFFALSGLQGGLIQSSTTKVPN